MTGCPKDVPSSFSIVSFNLMFYWNLPLTLLIREKEADRTQSYDKSPYTHRQIQKVMWQHNNATKKPRFHKDCGPTYNGQLA